MNKNFPSASITIFPTKNIFESIFETDESDLIILLSSTDVDGIPSPADLNQVYQKIALLDKAEVTEKPGIKESLVLKIKPEKLQLYHLDYNGLVNKLKSLFNANKIEVIAYNQRMIPLKIGNRTNQLYELINFTSISNEDKEEIPLKWIIEMDHVKTYKTIYGGTIGNFIPIPVNINDDNIEQFSSSFSNMIKDSEQFSYQLGGSIIKNEKMFRELIYVLIISVLLLYFILAAQFESVLQPFIILFEILIDISGALLLLEIFGSSLNIMSAIGIIVMSGIVINDSILKVDTINQLNRGGLSIRDAIFEAGKRRFNPIIMTTLTTVLAMVPLFFNNGMGVELQKAPCIEHYWRDDIGNFRQFVFYPFGL